MLNTNLNIVWGIFLSICPYFVLAFIPVWEQLRYSKKTVVMIGLLCMLLNTVSVILIITWLPDWNNLRFFHSAFFLLVYLVVYTVMVQGTPLKLMFVALLVKSYADFIVNMAKFFEIYYINHVLNQVYVHSSYSFYFNLFQCLILLISYPLIWIFFRKKISQVMQTNNKAWRYLWIIPLVYYVISLAFAAMDFTLIAQWQFLLFNIASFLGFNLIYYVVIEMLEQSEKNVFLTANNELIKQQLVYQSDYYKKFGACIEETRKGEHDLRHHLNTVLGLIQQKNNEKVEQYIAELLGNRLSISDVLYCRNDAVNAILGYYVNACKQEGIDFSIATKVPNDLEIDETDLCVIFGNILENALEACRKITNANKFIKISSQFLNNKLYITVDNSFEGPLKLKNGIYLSQKREAEAGIGMLSVMGMAKKYSGEASFQVVDKTFCVSIFLNNKSN
ncbi:sensor histidine kinase [Acetobacterium woodii]|uniref:Two-component sensor kinase n=1 Tax=Acetobacterium woodii (strain ATCC 29683 / DSM 1030 / JCM 2381 / KCTC 1655 / WB1) TaxID=931626 RepID=H6LEZ0_ACEWD|nr:sensor histidine kinase [Acetobacterium woodii]AFA46896.1 two-component sensor kinase [Acetobacterium woodii DSM 1030]